MYVFYPNLMSVSTYIQVPIHTRVPKHEPEVSLCCAPQGGRPVREKDRDRQVLCSVAARAICARQLIHRRTGRQSDVIGGRGG